MHTHIYVYVCIYRRTHKDIDKDRETAKHIGIYTHS